MVEMKHLIKWLGRRDLSLRAIVAASLFALVFPTLAFAEGLNISDRYSHKNGKRPIRPRTDYIILHTTEAPDKSSLQRIAHYGLAHYVITTDGHIYRTIYRKRLANHAGRSMWEGRKNIDQYSIGIEVVGYHNGSITSAQSASLRELLRQLKSIYGIEDDAVLTHSMVAYGAPNSWNKRSHRGRKRCGMLFARPDVRERLGLTSKPTRDPDVSAGRLSVGDRYLASVLYGDKIEEINKASAHYSGSDADIITSVRTAWFIAREMYNHASTLYIFPGGTKKRGNQIRHWDRIPSGTRVVVGDDKPDEAFEGFREIGVDGDSARALAGAEYNRKTTVYFMTDGRVRLGDELAERELQRLGPGTKVLIGYTYGGYISAGRSAYDICGVRYRYPSTYYRLPGGKISSGDEINEARIPRGTSILFRN